MRDGRGRARGASRSVTRFLAALAALALGVPALAHPGPGIVVDRDGRVFFVDTFRNRILRLDPDGKVAVVVADEAGEWLRLPHHL